MMTSGFGRGAITSCIVVAMLAGCGASQPPISASSATAQISGIAMSAPCSGSNSTNGVLPLLTEAPSNRSRFDRPSDVRNAASKSRTFYYTGAEQSFKVPSGITSINVVADGAAGASYEPQKVALGGRTQALIPVTPRETLYVFVGGQGSFGSGGFNGGGGVPNDGGYGGGGASDVRENGDGLSDRILIAGAGGGEDPHGGGAGGGTTGRKGGGTGAGGHGGGGAGGNQSQGGSGGIGGYYSGHPGGSGALGAGGTGGQNGSYSSQSRGNGGGGGGGYYGGGGGGGGGSEECGPAFPGGGGAGGSSYIESSASGAKMYQGWKHDKGNGQVVFSW